MPSAGPRAGPARSLCPRGAVHHDRGAFTRQSPHGLRLLAASGLALVAASLTSCGVEESRNCEDDGALSGAITSVRLDDRAGGVTVGGVENGSHWLRRTVPFQGERPEGATHRIEGRVLILGGCGTRCSVQYAADVPAGLPVGGEVSGGAVRPARVGEVEVSTGSGGVELDGDTGTVPTRTTNGRIDGKGIGGDRIGARTTNGRIDLAPRTPPPASGPRPPTGPSPSPSPGPVTGRPPTRSTAAAPSRSRTTRPASSHRRCAPATATSPYGTAGPRRARASRWPQHSTICTAGPPRAVSLYVTGTSAPCRAVPPRPACPGKAEGRAAPVGTLRESRLGGARRQESIAASRRCPAPGAERTSRSRETFRIECPLTPHRQPPCPRGSSRGAFTMPARQGVRREKRQRPYAVDTRTSRPHPGAAKPKARDGQRRVWLNFVPHGRFVHSPVLMPGNLVNGSVCGSRGGCPPFWNRRRGWPKNCGGNPSSIPCSDLWEK